MKSYKLLALVALASIFMLNSAVADDNVTLLRTEVGASDMSEFIGELQDGDTIQINQGYEATGTLILERNNFIPNLSIVGSSSESVPTPTVTWDTSSADWYNFMQVTGTRNSPEFNLTLDNVNFENGISDYQDNGGFGKFNIQEMTIEGTDVDISNCSADANGGAFYFSNDAAFKGDGSSMTFTGNQAKNVNNDIYCVGNLVFTDAGTYSLDGGIETGSNGSLSLTNGVSINFSEGATNSLGALNILGENTLATFAEGTTTNVIGQTTIEDTGTTTVDESEVSNIQFAGEETFVQDVDIINSNVKFSGNEKFNGNVTLSNGSDVEFSGENSASGTVVIQDPATKAHFDGAQQLSNVQIKNHAQAESSASNTFTRSDIVVEDFGEFNVNEAFTSPEENIDTGKITVGNNGVVNLLWADESDVTGFNLNGNLIIEEGGTVNLGGETGVLNVGGNLSGDKGALLNLSIKKATLDANASDGDDSDLTDIDGNSITVNGTLAKGNKYINVTTLDEFAYHEETQSLLLIELEGGQGMQLKDFLATVQLPFAWLGSLDENNFSIHQDKDAYGSRFYIFKVDGDKVPEPSTWALMILGVAGLYFVRRKNNAK